MTLAGFTSWESQNWFMGSGERSIGVDASLYHMPDDLKQYYGGSSSYHVFLRWRPSVQTAHVH